MTISGTETFVFTPSSKRAGTFTITRNGKAVLDDKDFGKQLTDEIGLPDL